MKRTSTAAEKRHLAAVAAMGCICCSHCHGIEDSPSVVHHVRVTHGWGRSGHTMAIPLCEYHHTGKEGVHNMGRAQFEHMHDYSEIDLLAIVQDRLAA